MFQQAIDSKADIESLFNAELDHLARKFPAEEVAWPALNDLGLRFWCKRDDMLNPLVSGNKLYKLWGHLADARNQGATRILSFGGAYSNHLHALAGAGHGLGLATVGVIRGQRPASLSPTLEDCRRLGMELLFVSRMEYREKQAGSLVTDYLREHPGTYVVPEGGGGEPGRRFCAPLMAYLESVLPPSSVICLPCGTGTTFEGLLGAASGKQELLGISAVKASSKDFKDGRPQMVWDIEQRRLQEASSHQPASAATEMNWSIRFDHHCGGYGKAPDYLLDFMADFEASTGIPLDPVYTGKMMYAIYQMAAAGVWPAGQNILALHTGGLQGRRGLGKPSAKQLQMG